MSSPVVASDPVLRLTAKADRIQFPAYCVECGATATRWFMLRDPRVSGPLRTGLRVPACERCSDRKVLRQLLWVLGSTAIGSAVMILTAMLMDALIADVPALRSAVMPMFLVALALGIVPMWWGLRRGRAAFHRRFSAVWIDDVDREVTLGFRRPALRDDMMLLAGVPLPAAGDAPYRGVAPVAPKPFVATRIGPSAVLIIAAGLVICGAGVVMYVMLGRAEARHETFQANWLAILIYKVAGRTGLLVVISAFGGAFAVMGLSMYRKARRRLIAPER